MMQEPWVQSLGQEDPLERGMATHSSIIAWRIQWTAEPGGLQYKELQRVGHNWVAKHSTLQMLKGIWNWIITLGNVVLMVLELYFV